VQKQSRNQQQFAGFTDNISAFLSQTGTSQKNSWLNRNCYRKKIAGMLFVAGSWLLVPV
jgi:hypothetical protein